MQLWRTGGAMVYGGAIGAAAAAFKLFAPWSAPHTPAAMAGQIIAAALAFALLCGGAAALRNFLMRRFVDGEGG